jgi:ArsR family transcriptional regulator
MEILQKVFKTLSDPTRVRVLALLEQEELAVQELMDVLGMAQSRVSRHLAILREAGLLQDRREGTHVFYRFAIASSGPWRDAWALVRTTTDEDPTRERDNAALAQIMQARATRTRDFFDAVGPEWDALRKVFNDDTLRAQAVAHLVAPSLTVADIGTGTGILAAELHRLGLRVIAIDHSARMLEAARSKLDAEGATEIELRRGEVSDLPLADGEVDAALAHMVLHYLPSPGEAIREMARSVKPDGVVIVVDFLAGSASRGRRSRAGSGRRAWSRAGTKRTPGSRRAAISPRPSLPRRESAASRRASAGARGALRCRGDTHRATRASR